MTFVKSSPGSTPIVVEAAFAVAPSEVFAAWTDPKRIVKWFGTSPGSIHHASIDLTPGGRWRLVEAAGDDGVVGFEGIYLEIAINQRLLFSWVKFTEHANGDKTVTPPSKVEITFAESTVGTEMRIVHSEIDAANLDFAVGWNGGIANLATLLRPAF